MAKSARLGRGATRKIGNAIEDLFNNAKARLLGPQSIQGKKIHIGFVREMSLPGIFEAGSLEEMVKPDLDILESLIRVAGSYIDAHKERTKARVVHEINGAMAEAKHTGGMSQSDFRGLVNTKLSEVWADVTRNIHSIVDTELSHAKNVSVLDGVIGSNAAAGVDDPVVYFVVVRDNILCKECKRLHLMDDEKTPRLWYLSELGHGYHKKGEENPKIGGLHPHCRCTLVTLLPSYGFTNDGMVKYVKRGHLELPIQRGLARSEEEIGEPLEKMAVLYESGERPIRLWRMQNAQGHGPHGTALTESEKGVVMRWRMKPKTFGKIPPGANVRPEMLPAMRGWFVAEPGDQNQHITTQPFPSIEFPASENKLLTRSGGHLFAFSHPSQAEKWFGGKDRIQKLAAEGFTLQPVHAQKAWQGPMSGQVFFKPWRGAATAEPVDAPHPSPHVTGQPAPDNARGFRLHKAISEIPVGPELQDFPYRDPFPSENAPKHFDYNHLLPPEHQGKYAMVVTQTPDFAPKPEDHDSDKSGPWHFPVNKGKHHLTANLFKLLPAFKTREAAEASITKPKERWTKFDHDWVKEQSTPRRAFVGHAIGHIDNGELSPHFSDGIAPEFKGMKFGTALYSAIFAHARNGLGAHTVKGGLHTVEAARVHESLSRQHGMAYKSTVRKMPKNPKVNTPAHMIRYRIPGGRKITQLRGPYKYALKNELSPLKKALARWENKVFGDIFDLLAKIEAPTIHQSDFLKELQDFGWMPDGDNKHKDSQVHIAGPSWTGFQHSDDAILNAKKQEKYLKQLGLTRFPHRAQWHFAINPRLGKLAAGQGEDALRARHLFEAYKAGGYLDTHSMDAVRAKADAEKAHDNPMPEDAEIEKAKARALSAQAAIARRTAGA